MGDQIALEALVRFSEEELKHQELYIFSGVQVQRFMDVLTSMTTEAQRDHITTAL